MTLVQSTITFSQTYYNSHMAMIFHRKQHTIKQISPVPPWYLLDNILYISVLEHKEKAVKFCMWGWIWVVHERYIKVYQKECMNTFMICPGMVCKLVVSCVVFSRWCVLQLSNVLFLCLDLNGFKEAISQQESEERMVVVWLYLVLPFFVCVTFRCRSSLVWGFCEVTNWEVAKFQKKG